MAKVEKNALDFLEYPYEAECMTREEYYRVRNSEKELTSDTPSDKLMGPRTKGWR